MTTMPRSVSRSMKMVSVTALKAHVTASTATTRAAAPGRRACPELLLVVPLPLQLRQLLFERLLLKELGVHPAAPDQAGVRPGLDDATLVQHHDQVGVAHGREAMGNHHDGLPACRFAQRV